MKPEDMEFLKIFADGAKRFAEKVQTAAGDHEDASVLLARAWTEKKGLYGEAMPRGAIVFHR